MSEHEPKHILVVDDLAIYREPIQMALRGEGYEVATAADGKKATLALSNRCPDLILLDMRMPGMSGLKLLKHIRDTGRFAHIPVLVLSSVEDHALVQEAAKLGISGYLQKSQFSYRSLLGRIEQILEPHAGLGEHASTCMDAR